MLKSYLKRIFDVANRGDAREESYYSALEGLLRKYTESVGKNNIQITTLLKKTEAGNPDFRIWDGNNISLDILKPRVQLLKNLDRIENQIENHEIKNRDSDQYYSRISRVIARGFPRHATRRGNYQRGVSEGKDG